MATEPTIKATKKISDHDGWIFHCVVTTADGNEQPTQIKIPYTSGEAELKAALGDELDRICREHEMAENVMFKSMKLGDLKT